MKKMPQFVVIKWYVLHYNYVEHICTQSDLDLTLFFVYFNEHNSVPFSLPDHKVGKVR
jgi:hypothetical protein